MGRWLRGSACAAAVVAIGGCSLLFSVSDNAAKGTDATSADALAPEVAVIGDGGGHDGDSITCPPALGGPDLVSAGSFCIDRTEVTAGQYAMFLASGDDGGGADRARPVQCADNGGHAVRAAPPSPDHPVLVDWCDAFAFCAWAGKRLCGAIDGGAIDPTTTQNLTKGNVNSWLAACEGPQRFKLPYGDEVIDGACAPDPAMAMVQGDYYRNVGPVGVHPLCEGAYKGLLDMVGNADEWIDACSFRSCYCMGPTNCASMNGGNANWDSASPFQHPHGFRCCYP